MRVLYGDPSQTVVGPDGQPAPDTGFFGKKGQAALDAAPEAATALDRAIAQNRASLKTSLAQNDYDSAVRRLRADWMAKMGVHTDQQRAVWAISTAKTTGEQSLDEIGRNPGDTSLSLIGKGPEDVPPDTTLGRLRAAFVREAIAQGQDPDGAVREADRAAAAQQVRARIQNDPLHAPATLESHMDVLGGMPETYHLQQEARQAAANYIVGQGSNPANFSKAGIATTMQPDAQDATGAFNPTDSAGYLTAMHGHEGTAKNPFSSAVGEDQFVGQTWLKVLKAHPQFAQTIAGKTDAQILALRADPKLADQAALAYGQDNAERLQGQGIAPTNSAVFAMHWWGPGDGPKVIKAAQQSPDTPMSAIVGQHVADINGVGDKTAGQVMRDIQRRFGGAEYAAGGGGSDREQAYLSYWREQARAALGDNDPGGVEGVIKRIGDNLRSARALGSANARVTVSSALDNATSMVEHGQQSAVTMPSDAVIDAAFPYEPERAAVVKEQRDDILRISGFLGTLPDATPAQVAQLRLQVQPDPKSPDTYAKQARIAGALDAALDRRARALADDPAAYVLSTHPKIAAAWGVVTASGQPDLTKYGAYADQVKAVQTAIGVRPDQQAALPAANAKGFAQYIETHPEDAPSALQGIRRQVGEQYWPQFWRDLVQRGGLGPDYQAVGLIDPADGAMLARALAEPGKSGKSVTGLLPEKSPGQIKSAVKIDASVTGLTRSLMASGGSAAQADSVENSIETLAAANMAYKGMQQAPAVAAAIKAFTSRYRFLPEGGARVPADRFDAVTSNAGDTLAALSVAGVQLPTLPGGKPIFGTPGAPSAEDYVLTLKQAPTWITSPNADALWLMDPYGRIVRGRNGQPVSVSFNSPAPVRREMGPAEAAQFSLQQGR